MNFEAETEVAKKIPLGNHRRALRMDPDRTPKSLLDPGQILDVIDVPVGKEKESQVNSFAHQPVAGTIGGVKKDPALRRLEGIAIRLKDSPGKSFVFDHLFALDLMLLFVNHA